MASPGNQGPRPVVRSLRLFATGTRRAVATLPCAPPSESDPARLPYVPRSASIAASYRSQAMHGTCTFTRLLLTLEAGPNVLQ
jgi:hypothetical protein